MRSVVLGLVLCLTLIAMPAGEAGAQEQSCALDEESRLYVCRIIQRARPGGPPVSVDIDGPGPLPIQWSRQLSNGLPGALYDCYYQDTDGVDIIDVYGVGWAVFITNNDTGETRLAGFDCEYPGEDPPQPPPPPPTPGAIVEQSRDLLELTTGLSPSAERRGVSQLETWLWCEGAEVVTLDPSLDGYSIVANVGVDGLSWTIDGPDGRAVRTAQTCGVAPHPDSDGSGAAATWIPNNPGVSTITQTATWTGAWTLTYTDPTFGTFLLGTFDFPIVPVISDPIAYEVYEIQTVGVAPPSD